MAKLESLVVSLEAETALLRKGLDDAKKQVEDFGKKLNDLAGVVEFKELGGLAVEAGRKLAEFALHGSEVVDAMGKAAQSAGISTEQFSRYAYAANLSGVSTEDLGAAFSKLNVALAKAGAGVAEQRALFSALGIAVKDAQGNVRGTDQVLADLADRFADMRDGASKTALAVDVFGKSGARLIPFLNEGRDGLAELTAEADRLGITIDGSAAKAAEHFNDNLQKLRSSFDAVAGKVAANLAPALSNLTDQLLNSKDGAQALKDLADVLTTALRILTTAAVGIAAAFQVVGEHIGAVASAVVHAAEGDFGAALDDLKGAFSDAAATVEAAGARIEAVWSNSAKTAEASADGQKKSGDKTLATFEAMKKGAVAYDEAVKEITKLTEEYQSKIAGFGLGPVEQLAAKLNSGELTKGVKSFTGELGKAVDKLLELARAANDLELTKISVDLNFKVSEEFTSAMRDFAARSAAYSNIGNDQRSQVQSFLDQSGIKSFDEALANLAQQTELFNQKQADLEVAKFQKDDEEIRRQEAQLNIQTASLDSAKKVADGFQKLGELDYSRWKENLDRVVSTIGAFSSQLASKLGELGSVIQSTVQGFQQGGWYGAVAALIVEVFSRFQRFSELIDLGTKQLGGLIAELGPSLSVLTDGFKELMQTLGKLTDVIGRLLSPVIQVIGFLLGKVAEIFAPMVGTLESLTDGLAPVTAMLEELTETLSPFDDAIKIISVIFNAVSLTILGTVYGIETMFAGILKAIRDAIGAVFGTDNDAWRGIYDAEHKLDVASGEAADKINQIANHISDAFATGTGVGTTDTNTYMYGQLSETTQYMQVQFNGVGDAAKGAAASIAKMTEQLTNVPEGFKYALAKFDATQAKGGSGGAYAFGNTTPVTVQVTVQGSVVTEQNLISAVRKGLQISNFRNNGVPNLP
jgi:predicted RNase H-like HicB family nuclease